MSSCSYTVNEAGVATMIINNPPMNALSAAVVQDIEKAVKDAVNDDAVRAIVFTGEGRAFIAGADIKELATIDDQKAAAEFLAKGQEAMNSIENSPKPFIAAINGFALGGGLELALACHIRIADEKAQLGLPEIKLGIIPGYGGTQRSTRLIGMARAMELVLSGEFISAQRAAEYGLVNRVAPAGSSLDEAITLATAIAKRGRPALNAALKALREGAASSLDKGLEIEREAFASLVNTENKKEGIAAFIEKREPKTLDS